MKIAFLSAVLALSTSGAFAGQLGSELPQQNFAEMLRKLNNNDNIIQVSMTCFLNGEQRSGMNKICFYDCLGSAAAITVSSVSLCPLTIKN